MSRPLISVVIPVFNGEAFVADAIESVLAQHDAKFEVIAVDDGSTDRTAAVLARFDKRIRIHRQPNRGTSAARNGGINLARGKLLVFLDADDLHPPGYLARFSEAAAARPEAEVFHCGMRAVDFDRRFLYGHDAPLPLDDDPFHALAGGGAPHIAALAVRSTTAARVGPFNQDLEPQGDWDYWLRLAAAGAVFRGVPGNVAIVRRRRDSESGTAAGRMALIGLAVLELNLAGHPRCPACPLADAGVAAWRRAALHSSALEFQRRLHLPGRPGRWMAAAIAVARTPRLASAAWAELLPHHPAS